MGVSERGRCYARSYCSCSHCWMALKLQPIYIGGHFASYIRHIFSCPLTHTAYLSKCHWFSSNQNANWDKKHSSFFFHMESSCFNLKHPWTTKRQEKTENWGKVASVLDTSIQRGKRPWASWLNLRGAMAVAIRTVRLVFVKQRALYINIDIWPKGQWMNINYIEGGC